MKLSSQLTYTESSINMSGLDLCTAFRFKSLTDMSEEASGFLLRLQTGKS